MYDKFQKEKVLHQQTRELKILKDRLPPVDTSEIYISTLKTQQ